MDETLNHPGHELHGEDVEAYLESFRQTVLLFTDQSAVVTTIVQLGFG
jgi:hypothetical protein